jgi:hypothetical protein
MSVRQMTTLYRRNLLHMEKSGATYFVNFSTRKEFFLVEEARTLVFDHCLFENGRKVHMLFTPLLNKQGQPYSLAEIMQGIKGTSSHSVNKLLGRKGALWEAGSFDRMTRSDGDFEFRLLYIMENPIAAGLAKGPDDYRWAWRESAQPRAAAVHDPD